MSKKTAVHTEYMLHECVMCPTDDEETPRLFRAPTVHDGSGTHKRLPHEIRWDEAQVGDVLLALLTDEMEREDGGTMEVMFTLQVWRVLKVNGEELTVLVKNLVGMAADGEFVYDRLAGLVGAPPSEGSG